MVLTFQQPLARIPSATIMRKLLPLILSVLAIASVVRGETPTTPNNMPVEITSSGETTYENGIATARDNVAIHVGDTDIYADRATYNSATHDVTVEGHVRLYRGTHLYVGESGIYNIDTKEIHARNMRGEYQPYFVTADEISVINDNETVVKNGTFTTDDSADPSFHLRAQNVRIYENDRVVFQNVTFYVGKVPIFWWPYLYQSLDDSFSFSISPAFLSSWGPSLLDSITFPIRDNIVAACGLITERAAVSRSALTRIFTTAKTTTAVRKLKTYYLQDQNPELNRTNLPREPESLLPLPRLISRTAPISTMRRTSTL